MATKYTADLPQPVRCTTRARRLSATSASIARHWSSRSRAGAGGVPDEAGEDGSRPRPQLCGLRSAVMPPCNPMAPTTRERAAASLWITRLSTGVAGSGGPRAGPSSHDTEHHEPEPAPADEQQVTLRGPAELADALPVPARLPPEDSIVLVALHGERGRFGGRLRLGIPPTPRGLAGGRRPARRVSDRGQRAARRPARRASSSSSARTRPRARRAAEVMERLRPLAQRLRTACGSLDVPVIEALCISDGRFWSYCCPDAALLPGRRQCRWGCRAPR